ncbi:MAG TPA: RNA 2',3'-cyclic phosphodiesterase [Acidiferrobacterales bacterium]|nr:RNA 2',3'-cyclic phosphodiesterase [Acidiferrobacterales bacterium]
MDIKRLFFALWPDERTRARLLSVGAPPDAAAGRWLAGSHLHLTLVFLGNVDARRQDCVQQAASGITGKRFDLVLDVLGYWRHSHILWLGAGQTPSELLSLVDALHANLANCGFVAEARAYHPHITLARKLRKNLAGTAIAAVCWPVDRFVLVESSQERGGVKYEIVKSWDLADS